jgi:hypothetical protein
MATVPVLREAFANLRLASYPPEHRRNRRAFRPSDLFFSSGKSFSGLLQAVRPVRMRFM